MKTQVRTQRRASSFALAVVLASSLVACGSSSKSSSSATTAGGSSSSSATTASGSSSSSATTAGGSSTSVSSEPFKIFVPADLTGADASFGVVETGGIKAAADYINAHGGIAGRQIELTIKDVQTNPAIAVTETQNALTGGGYQAVMDGGVRLVGGR